MYKNIYYTIICNDEKLEATLLSIIREQLNTALSRH